MPDCVSSARIVCDSFDATVARPECGIGVTRGLLPHLCFQDLPEYVVVCGASSFPKRDCGTCEYRICRLPVRGSAC